MALFVSYRATDENGESGFGYATIDGRSPPKTPREVKDLIKVLLEVKPSWQDLALINWIELEEDLVPMSKRG